MTSFSNYKSGTYGKNSTRTEGCWAWKTPLPLVSEHLLPREDFCSLLIAFPEIVWTHRHIYSHSFSYMGHSCFVFVFSPRAHRMKIQGASSIRSLEAGPQRAEIYSVLVPLDLQQTLKAVPSGAKLSVLSLLPLAEALLKKNYVVNTVVFHCSTQLNWIIPCDFQIKWCVCLEGRDLTKLPFLLDPGDTAALSSEGPALGALLPEPSVSQLTLLSSEEAVACNRVVESGSVYV